MIELNENNFKEELAKHPHALVFFYREKGCSFCDKMKPVFEDLVAPYVKASYALGNVPDSITNGLVDSFPTFAAYAYGELIAKQEGVLTEDQLHSTFYPQEIKPKKLSVKEAPLIMLLTDEANLIDQLVPLRNLLREIQAEIRERREVASG